MGPRFSPQKKHLQKKRRKVEKTFLRGRLHKWNQGQRRKLHQLKNPKVSKQNHLIIINIYNFNLHYIEMSPIWNF